MSNTPDDWNSHWHTCPRCENRYHASEGCDCDSYCPDCGTELEDDECPVAECGWTTETDHNDTLTALAEDDEDRRRDR